MLILLHTAMIYIFWTRCLVFVSTGQKYEVAMKWKINIITPQWVEDSLKAGFCMQESKYSINVDRDDRPKTTSTPTGQHTGGMYICV